MLKFAIRSSGVPSGVNPGSPSVPVATEVDGRRAVVRGVVCGLVARRCGLGRGFGLGFGVVVVVVVELVVVLLVVVELVDSDSIFVTAVIVTPKRFESDEASTGSLSPTV